MNQLRKNILTGDLSILAEKRAKRPGDLLKVKGARKRTPKRGCLFEEENMRNESILSVYPASAKDNGWRAVIIKNKYPTFIESGKDAPKQDTFYGSKPSKGYHHILVTKDHDKNFSNLSPADASLVFTALQEHSVRLSTDKAIKYISIFQNWGQSAGASIFHPHYQIAAMEIIPPKVQKSLAGSKKYLKAHGLCGHCAVIKHEQRQKTRVILENEEVIAIAPFASQRPFEINIFPKNHLADINESPKTSLQAMASALNIVLKSLYTALNDPDYNFYIRSAPMSSVKSIKSFYHWHIVLFPRLSISAGLELDSGVDVVVTNPDEAAKMIRENIV